ncbi:hypothetical protein [Streptomyces antarcticus]|uniref:hypothetical protein n=1 Tax=Streptomyces antarcticus TaxID=2996458 RepID=UPI00226EC262|nr:hypothetical protein [Streptomyces sp. H34-AA3]MCY0946297.1 hypothetical protein [Streptomyces sp. H34-AA3]
MTSPTVPHPAPAHPTLADIARQAAGTLPLTAYILQLLGAAAEIEARLAAAEAVFPGITRLTDEKPAALAVYRAERRNIPYATFTTREVARAWAEARLRRRSLPAGVTTGWVPDSGDEHADEDLVLFGPGRDDESMTSIRITVLPVRADYDPDAEG